MGIGLIIKMINSNSFRLANKILIHNLLKYLIM